MFKSTIKIDKMSNPILIIKYKSGILYKQRNTMFFTLTFGKYYDQTLVIKEQGIKN